jgi:hypothetical protein
MTEPKGETKMREIKLFVFQSAAMFTSSKIAMKFD